MSRLAYEKDLHGILVQLVKDMDRKIERQKERAAKESAPRPATPAEQATLDAIKVRAGRLVQLCLDLTEGPLLETSAPGVDLRHAIRWCCMVPCQVPCRLLSSLPLLCLQDSCACIDGCLPVAASSGAR